ncbi:MAG: FABP family protein [Actinomycetota bacterium]|nr:FABP family protein [Actinomycetota bacterium]
MELDVHPDLTALSFLPGTWRGSGRGEYPTIDPFSYDEEVVVEHVGDPFLLYLRSSWSADDREPLHLERGFIRPGPARGEVELCLADPIGLTEIAHGIVNGGTLDLSTDRDGVVGRTRTGLEVTALSRTYRVDGDRLTYELFMATERTANTLHLRGELRRVA